MNGRKKIIIIMIVLFGLLMTTGVSTWIITSQVTFAPSYIPPTELTASLTNVIEVTYNELGDKTCNGLYDAVAEKTKTELSFTDGAGETVALTYGKHYTYSVETFDDNGGNKVDDGGTGYAVGSTYAYKIKITLLSSWYGVYVFPTNEDGVTTDNITLTDKFVKYQTCQIGSKWYTVEDALHECSETSGQINLAGSTATADSGNIKTTFTKIENKSQIYPDDTYYTIPSGSTLRVPFAPVIDGYPTDTEYDIGGETNDGSTMSEGIWTPKSYLSSYTNLYEGNTAAGYTFKDHVYSVLTIPEELDLYVKGTLSVGSVIGQCGDTKLRGVIINKGDITVDGTLNSYGYIKGSGTITLNSGSSCNDVFRIYDWNGGNVSVGTYNANVFPINAYSAHNNACTTKICNGATYNAQYSIKFNNSVSFGVTLYAQKYISDKIGIIGDSSSNSLFKFETTSSIDDYIEKSAQVSADVLSSNAEAGQKDVLFLHGDFTDAPISIKVDAIITEVEIKSSPSVALPISYMDITVDGNLTLNSSSYKFLPGTSVTINENSSITIDGGVNAQFFRYSEMPYTHTEKSISFNNLCHNKVDAALNLNGSNATFTVTDGSQLCGQVTAKSSGAVLNLQGTTKSPLKYVTANGSATDEATTATYISNATGSVYYTSQDEGGNVLKENKELTATTSYKSFALDENANTFAWIEDKEITVQIICAGSTIGSVTGNSFEGVRVTQDDFTIPNTVKRTDMENLYYDSACTTNKYLIGTDIIHSDNILLHVQYTAKEGTYKITFDPNGGDIKSKEGIVYEKGVNLDDYIPEREYYVFDKWTFNGNPVSGTFTQADFGTDNYNITLVATWLRKSTVKVNDVNNKLQNSNGAGTYIQGTNASISTSMETKGSWFSYSKITKVEVIITTANGEETFTFSSAETKSYTFTDDKTNETIELEITASGQFNSSGSVLGQKKVTIEFDNVIAADIVVNYYAA